MRKTTTNKTGRTANAARLATTNDPVRFERRGGERLVILTQAQYRRLVDAAGGADAMPSLPREAPDGTMPALEFARATIARGIIGDRQSLAWSQAELARQAGIRVETLNKIERAKVTPDAATLRKIDRAIARGRKPRMRAAAAG